MDTGQIIILAVVLVAVAVGAFVAWQAMRRRELRNRFGPEYDRAVAEFDSRGEAERELRDRERRHGELELTELSRRITPGSWSAGTRCRRISSTPRPTPSVRPTSWSPT
ncbi:hypothetical protein ACFQY4_23380 [Catellatospora bangladeshensis]|uniref:hypothetical protein n=1 Tax=Catellatospora bangladeshensis TaxID=310355 RepID=UPI00360B709A